MNLNGVIQGSGGLRLVGQGDVALNALNSYAGTTYIGGIGITGTGDTMWAWANTLADTGVASSRVRAELWCWSRVLTSVA